MPKALPIQQQRPSHSLRHYLTLVVFMTYTDLRAESERTYIGFLWWIIEPLVSLAVYYIVFGKILIRPIDHYVVFLFVGLVPWRWLQTALLHGSVSILSAKRLMRQVYLPKIIFPVVAVLTNTFKFSLVFLIVIFVALLSGFPFSPALIALPGVLATQGLLIVACALLVAAVTPFLPDFRIVLENIIRLWFFLSGVFFDVNNFSAGSQMYFRLNPMVVILDSYRQIVLRGSFPDAGPLAVIASVSLALCFVGAQLIRMNDFRYPKLAL